MEAEDVVELYTLLIEHGVQIWIDGGWGPFSSQPPVIGMWEGVAENQVKIKSQLPSYMRRGRKLTHKRGRGVGGNLMP